jgi:hypothetical protein
MKKIFPLILLAAMLLSACGGTTAPDDSALATKVAEMLTAMPSPTGQAGLPPTVEPTLPAESPTLEPITPTVVVITATPLPTNTPAPTEVPPTATPVPPTETLVPTETPVLPTPTVVAGDPRNRLGNPAWRDGMDNDNNWPTGSDTYTAIEFKDGNLLLTGLEPINGWRISWPELTDFYLEMTVKVGTCNGSDQYGFISRVPKPSKPNQGYLLGLTCDGRYFLRKWDGETQPKGTMTNLIEYTANSAIKSGSNQTNRLGLMAVGNRLLVYVNGVLLGEARDSQFSSGNFGLFVYAKETDNLLISVDEVSYWENPTP